MTNYWSGMNNEIQAHELAVTNDTSQCNIPVFDNSNKAYVFEGAAYDYHHHQDNGMPYYQEYSLMSTPTEYYAHQTEDINYSNTHAFNESQYQQSFMMSM